MLNTRLAAAESMTHDVIRDLLGVKLDMTSCVVRSLINLSAYCFFITMVHKYCSSKEILLK